MLQVQLLQPSNQRLWIIYFFDIDFRSLWPANGKQITVSVQCFEAGRLGWGAKPFHSRKLFSAFEIVGHSCLSATLTGPPPSAVLRKLFTPVKTFFGYRPVKFGIREKEIPGGAYRVPNILFFFFCFPRFIRGWRQGFGEKRFPFLIVAGLPKSGIKYGTWRFGIWAELREPQLFTVWLSIPNTGPSVTIDVGDARHLPSRPAEKPEVRASACRLGRLVNYLTGGKN